MKNAKITCVQLFSLLVLFQLGTSIVVGFGLDAKKDAWIAILVGSWIGILIFLIFHQLYILYSKPLTSYSRDILGKYLGFLVGIFYVVYFLYGSARDLRDVGDLLASSVYNVTPLFVINLFMMVAIAYVLNKGIVVLARLSELYLLILICLSFLGNMLVLISGLVEVNNLFPILENGFEPILTTIFPNTTVFPFGELVCFTMVFHYLNTKENSRKIGIYSILLSGLILAYSTSINVAVLGMEITQDSTFPLFSTISLINIADFIQRLDAIVVLTLFIGAFFKTSLFYYAAVIAASDLFKVKQQTLVLPFGIIILLLSMFIAADFAEHLEEGKLSLKTIHVIFGLFIPLLLLIIAKFRKKGQKQIVNQSTEG